MLLFSGYTKTYGLYGGTLQDQGDGKLKGSARTVKGEVTQTLWIDHLTGKQGLGIIPIDESSRVRFAAIDIDEYPLDLEALNRNIQKLQLPLVLCRTKSGGAHLYLFLETFSPADQVQKKMREMAALLGHGNAEIFPKQTKILEERGDAGSWINMPYYQSMDTSRYALDAEGKKLSFQNFIRYAQSKIVSFNSLVTVATVVGEILVGGPPCMNHLCSMGFPQGTRNNGLFNLAVYAKKLHGDEWPMHIQEYNDKYMTPPLDPSEVQGIIKSMLKKDFTYTCKQAPISNYCNMPKCRTCKYGIGLGNMGMPKFGSLTKLLTDPPVWFLEVEAGGRLELTTDDLQSPRNFQNKCMATLNIMPMVPKMETWQEVVAQLLEQVNEVEIPIESTPKGQLWGHLEDFLTSRVQGRTADDMLLGKPWLSNGVYYFRLKDFLSYLDRQKFKLMPLHHIAMCLSEWKLGRRFWNCRGKGVNSYSIPEKSLQKQVTGFDPVNVENPEKVIT